jgi:hypothetical protein
VRINKEDLNVLVLPVILLAPVVMEVALLMVSGKLGVRVYNVLIPSFLNVYRVRTNAANYN